MRRILFLLVLALFALPLMHAHSAVESYRAANTAADNEAQPKKNYIVNMDCGSADPELAEQCVKELSMAVNYLTANNNEAMNWLRNKSQKPELLREAFAYCVESAAPEGQLPSFPDLHRCARKRLGP